MQAGASDGLRQYGQVPFRFCRLRDVLRIHADDADDADDAGAAVAEAGADDAGDVRHVDAEAGLALLPFFGGGFPTKNRLQTKVGTLILTSLLEDLGDAGGRVQRHRS